MKYLLLLVLITLCVILLLSVTYQKPIYIKEVIKEVCSVPIVTTTVDGSASSQYCVPIR